jgi:hypothetical protein
MMPPSPSVTVSTSLEVVTIVKITSAFAATSAGVA